MKVTFENPGVDYMIEGILEFQTEQMPEFWMEPLYHFYPQLDRAYVRGLGLEARRAYLARTLRGAYAALAEEIEEKVRQYQQWWDECEAQVTAALSDAFGVDCRGLFNDLRCRVGMNPIEPRFLRERRFDIFYRNSARGAVGESIHELVHFVWFYVWNRKFGDSYDEYERPSMKWVLSEMVVEAVMGDHRLSSINPYYPREQGGCVYPYFFDMMVEERPILETLEALYRSRDIGAFMEESYAYCLAHEQEIWEHIRRSEG